MLFAVMAFVVVRNIIIIITITVKIIKITSGVWHRVSTNCSAFTVTAL